MKKRILFLFAALLALVILLAAWLFTGSATAFQQDKYYLFVKTGMNFDQLMDSLSSDQVLKSNSAFRWAAIRTDYPRQMKAGRYEIKAGMSILSILRMLQKGRQAPLNLLITKLRTKEDLCSLVGRKLECDSAALHQWLENNDSLKAFHLDSNTVMTAVFPNTYSFYWNTTPQRVFRKLIVEYRNFWTPARIQLAQERGLTEGSAYILASLVEEETNRKEDKGRIASVYINRLSKGMKLSADPTIKFAMRNFELKRVYDKYLLVESPYNTYKYAGLPPGPICTPSKESLEAVLSAPTTNFLYFVAKPDFSGFSNFAETYEQHLTNARAYQHALDQEMNAATSKKEQVK